MYNDYTDRAFSMIRREWAGSRHSHVDNPKTEEEKDRDLMGLARSWTFDAPNVSAETRKNLYNRVSNDRFRGVYGFFMNTLIEAMGG